MMGHYVIEENAVTIFVTAQRQENTYKQLVHMNFVHTNDDLTAVTGGGFIAKLETLDKLIEALQETRKIWLAN